jgi:hypothetical protein
MRKMLRRQHGKIVSRQRVRRLMKMMGLEAIYRRPRTSKPEPGHKIYRYLLRGLNKSGVGVRSDIYSDGERISVFGCSNGLEQPIHIVLEAFEHNGQRILR